MSKALVVFSGGQDSTTALFWAKSRYETVHALTFDYQQRHSREIDAAITIAARAGLTPRAADELPSRPSHAILKLGKILVGSSPLVNPSVDVGKYPTVANLPGGIEPTFVPERNLLFLTIAANQALFCGCGAIVTGVCQEDSGGYPDCRDDFIKSFIETQALASGSMLDVVTPLMFLTKAESVNLARVTSGAMESLAYSHTCYDGQYPPNPHNHASLLRARGFAMAGVGDPLIMRAKAEGKLPSDYPDNGLVEGTKYAMKSE